jgi:hypothetical protein
MWASIPPCKYVVLMSFFFLFLFLFFSYLFIFFFFFFFFFFVCVCVFGFYSSRNHSYIICFRCHMVLKPQGALSSSGLAYLIEKLCFFVVKPAAIGLKQYKKYEMMLRGIDVHLFSSSFWAAFGFSMVLAYIMDFHGLWILFAGLCICCSKNYWRKECTIACG